MKLKRTHKCTNLSSKNVGDEVVISGWVQKRRDHGGLIFVDLRDRSGIVQTVFDPENKDVFKVAGKSQEKT